MTLKNRNLGLMKNKDHYNETYFDYQKDIGLFGGLANKIKFENLIKKDQKVLDFGCGGGYLLDNFNQIEKNGVEINKEAIQEAKKKQIKIYNTSSELPSNTFDLIISNHALEHCDNPLIELKELYRSLKINGIICIVVPLETSRYKYFENDINFHLYSWSPLNLGNILNNAGFKVIESKTFEHAWFPFHKVIKKFVSWRTFHILCKIYSKISIKYSQTRAIAKKIS